MKRSKAKSDVKTPYPGRAAPAYAITIVATIAVWLLFTGRNIHLLSIGFLLFLPLLLSALWRGYKQLAIPINALLVTSLLYVAWLGVTLLWSPVPYISHMMFWWMAVLPLAFWLFIVVPDRDRLWSYLSPGVLLIGVLLAAVGLWEAWVEGVVPRGPFSDRNLYATTLNLIALATAGYYLKFHGESRLRRFAPWLAAAVVLLVTASLATKGRGPALTLLGGACLLAILAGPYVKRRMVFVAGMVVLSFVLADVFAHGTIVDRLATLIAPSAAGASRFVIWRQSWTMLMDHPWFGIGLGMYPLMWPPYRAPSDDSSGYFVHNDYLQIWIEGGLPALILFVALWAFLGWRVIRALRRPDIPPATKVEIAGLSAALAAVAAHSLLEFDFYVVTTLLVCGLIIGRLTVLTASPNDRTLVVHVADYIPRLPYRLLTLFVLLMPAIYFARVAIASIETDRANVLMKQGRLVAAEQRLDMAMHVWPASDSIPMTLADLYRSIIAASPTASPEQRAQVVGGARALLDRAIRINPYRADSFAIRAEVMREGARFTPGDPSTAAMIEADYRQALRLVPRYVFARTRYADWLLANGERERAERVLERGLAYVYAPDMAVVKYYLLAAHLREQGGDTVGARVLSERANAMKASLPGIEIDSHPPIANP